MHTNLYGSFLPNEFLNNADVCNIKTAAYVQPPAASHLHKSYYIEKLNIIFRLIKDNEVIVLRSAEDLGEFIEGFLDSNEDFKKIQKSLANQGSVLEMTYVINHPSTTYVLYQIELSENLQSVEPLNFAEQQVTNNLMQFPKMLTDHQDHDYETRFERVRIVYNPINKDYSICRGMNNW